jgi:hypothetical protein
MKYKVGDKVRIVSERPKDFVFFDKLEKYLGKTLTVIKVEWSPVLGTLYWFKEAIIESGFCAGDSWAFRESWISGLADPKQEPCTVELRFDGMITTATLKRGGRDVKTAEARCNPKDTYSRAEGARVAVERLFEKKRKEGKPKVGDKFVVVQKCYLPQHCFAIGDIVTLEAIGTVDNLYRLGKQYQYVNDRDLKPYKEKSK